MKKCTVEGCENKATSLGYCQTHYGRFKRYGDSSIVKAIQGENRSDDRTYIAYGSMKTRCYNPNFTNFKMYGGRGIKVCDEWLGLDGYHNFLRDMGACEEGMSLDRKNNNGNYEKGNCRWATRHQQQANRSNANKTVGVGFSKDRNKWLASIYIQGKFHYLGHHINYEDAVKARKDAEIKFNIIL